MLSYQQLFQVSVRHAFYSDGVSRGLAVAPTPGCRVLLSRLGLLFRTADDGCQIIAPLDPAEANPTLLRPLGDDAPVFQFVLRAKDPYMLSVTDVALPDAGSEVFYFNNLREDIADSRNHLGDSVDDARVGEAITLVARTVYTHTFAAPTASATLTLTDLFGNETTAASFAYDDPVDAFALNLGAVDGLTPGRYILNDGTDQTTLYYDPGLWGQPVLGVIDVFHKTDTLTPDASDVVPAAYRFLSGDELTGNGDYTLQFEARTTTWQYVVVRKYSEDNIDLDLLTISGAIPFTKTTGTNTATFESDAEVAASETPQSLNLQHNGTTIRALPSPGIAHVLQAGDSPGSFLSRLYIYV